MQPLTTIELATCTIAELAALYFMIEHELWSGPETGEQRDRGFVNRELVRRALDDRSRGRTR